MNELQQTLDRIERIFEFHIKYSRSRNGETNRDLGAVIEAVEVELLQRRDLDSFFSSIQIGNTNVVLKFHDQGLRFCYTISGKEPAVSQYGETITLSIDQSLRLVTRGISLNLEGTLNRKGQGFVIIQRTDLRSQGGNVSLKKALLLLRRDGKSVAPELVLERYEGDEAGSNK